MISFLVLECILTNFLKFIPALGQVLVVFEDQLTSKTNKYQKRIENIEYENTEYENIEYENIEQENTFH